MASERWRAGAAPFGLAYERWGADDFAALKAKIQQCGGDPTYVSYLEQLQARAFGPPPETQVLRESFVAELDKITGRAASVLQQLDALSARVGASAMNRGDKSTVQARISNRRQGEVLRKSDDDAAQAEIDARPRLAALIAEANATPPTSEGRRKLEYISAGNRYRLPEFSFAQQSQYYSALRLRISEIARTLQRDKCAPFTAKMGLGQEMASYEVVGQVGTRMGEVVCQSYVATGHGEFRPMGSPGAGLYSVRSGDTTLVFQLGRYVSQSSAFFPPAAPLQQGVPAFRFEGVRQGGRTQPVSWGFLVNFLAQYGGPWTEFVRD